VKGGGPREHLSTMTQAFGFSRKTLVQNWFEERLAPGQPETDFPEKKTLRPKETDLASMDEYGMCPLGRIASNPPHVSHAAPDDGYREVITSAQEEFKNPRDCEGAALVSRPDAKFINEETVPEVILDKRRPIIGPHSGYCAALQRHKKDEGERCFDTSYMVSFGFPKRQVTRDRRKMEPAGISKAQQATEGIGVGFMIGEVWKENADPSQATTCQRAWSDDPAIRFIKSGGKKPPVSTKDVNSLPLGLGAHHRQQTEMKERNGKFYRIPTRITKGRDAEYGMSVFRDW